jgi:hypothetical protein
MQILRWFDNRYFTTLASVAIFLMIMTAIRRLTIPESEPLTARIRIIEEIRKYIHPAPPAAEEGTPAEKKRVLPRKRVVPKRIESALDRLRETRAPRETKVAKRELAPSRPKLDLKRPGPRERLRDSGSRLRIEDPGRRRPRRPPLDDRAAENVIEIARGSGTAEADTGDPRLRALAGAGLEGPGGGGEEGLETIALGSWTGGGEDGDAISGVMAPLLEWMREHPADFSAVERKFLRHETGDLTSRATFLLEDPERGGVRYELLLLYKPAVDELRICLIEGNRATQLIDEGLRERSNYLRTGSVAWSGSEKISIRSSQRTPDEAETRRFYRIFLSWWDRTRTS